MTLNELFGNKKVMSFEVFPPKPSDSENTIYEALDGLKKLHPDFISVTYGAGGGSNRSKTLQIASDVKNKYGLESAAHCHVSISQRKMCLKFWTALRRTELKISLR